MNLAYYIEVNVICIIILLIIQKQLNEKYIDKSTDKAVFNIMIWANIVFCISDMIAGVFRGKIFTGARTLIEISNLIYYEALVCTSFLWFMYVVVKLKVISIRETKKLIITSIPVIVFTIIALTNPLTNFLFYIDDKNLYVRGAGVYLHWLITWGYLIISTIITIINFVKTKNKQSRREIMPLLYFIVAPMIASSIQMFIYGVTTTQAGVTLSLVLIFVNNQHSLVFTDLLTGLNNRKGLYYYFEDRIIDRNQSNVTLMMLDLNDFKKINDSFGHLVGDQALITASQAIRQACYNLDGTYILCRYGGDEFVIVSIENKDNQNEQLVKLIENKLEENNQNETEYRLKFGIGKASGICKNIEDFENLLMQADKAMYENKQQLKKENINTSIS